MPRATFFCRLNYIEVKGNLGRGVQFSENFFITNDQSTIRSLIDPQSKPAMGSLEYESFLESPLAVYCKIPELAPGAEAEKTIDLLHRLNSFEGVFWLHGDSCVGHELAFIINGPTIHSNILQGLRTRADSTTATVTIPAHTFRDLVRFHRKALKRQFLTPASFHTKTNSSRYSRAFDHIERAQRATFPPEKITFYCSTLETLFSTSQAELAHQIAERVALILTPDAKERMQKYRFLKECYSFRSKYIHGSPMKEIGERKITEMSINLDATVRNAVEIVFNDKDLSSAIANEANLDEYMLKKIFI